MQDLAISEQQALQLQGRAPGKCKGRSSAVKKKHTLASFLYLSQPHSPAARLSGSHKDSEWGVSGLECPPLACSGPIQWAGGSLRSRFPPGSTQSAGTAGLSSFQTSSC